MVFLQVFGSLLSLAGLFLFVREQIRERAGEHSTMQAWKINLSGPPSLILIVIGVIMFVFPFTPWWNDNTTPKATSTTTTTLFPLIQPTVPHLVGTYYDEELGCDVVEWSDDFTANGWEIDVQVYKPQNGSLLYEFTFDTYDSLFGSVPYLCAWDFLDEKVGYMYQLWVWAYNDVGYADEPLFIEYYDF